MTTFDEMTQMMQEKFPNIDYLEFDLPNGVKERWWTVDEETFIVGYKKPS